MEKPREAGVGQERRWPILLGRVALVALVWWAGVSFAIEYDWFHARARFLGTPTVSQRSLVASVVWASSTVLLLVTTAVAGAAAAGARGALRGILWTAFLSVLFATQIGAVGALGLALLFILLIATRRAPYPPYEVIARR